MLADQPAAVSPVGGMAIRAGMKTVAGVNRPPDAREALRPMRRPRLMVGTPVRVMNRPIPVMVSSAVRFVTNNVMRRVTMTAAMHGMAAGVMMGVVPDGVSRPMRASMRHVPMSSV